MAAATKGRAGRHDAAEIRRKGPRTVAPWVRTRLRTAPGAAAGLFLLVLLTSCLAAAFPRAVDRYEDRGLRQAVAAEAPSRRILDVTSTDPGVELPPDERDEALTGDVTRAAYGKIVAALPKPFVTDADESSYGLRTVAEELPGRDDWLPRPDDLQPQFAMYAQNGLADHAKVAAGRLPGPGHTATRVEAAVTRETARTLRLRPGSVIHVPSVDARLIAVHITGVVTPRNPSGAYWSATPLLRTPQTRLTQNMPPMRFWSAALLVHPDAAPALLHTGPVERYWHLPSDTSTLRTRELPALRDALAYVTDGPGSLKVQDATGSTTTDVTSGLVEVVARFDELRSGITPVVSVAAYGTGTVACVVLFMAAGLTADRRRGELALLRARGGSLRGIGGRLLAETAVVAVPAGALGCLLAVVAVPGGRLSPAVYAAGAVVLVACAALPVRAMAAHRRARLHGARDDVATTRPSARRTVAELTVLVLAVGAIVALRRRGATDGGDGLVALAPVLVGVVAAFVLVRVYPLLLRRLIGPTGRLRGAVGHLSLARAARAKAGPGTTVLPLLALLTALTTAAFGGSVLAGIDTARDHAALLATGADARVDGDAPLSAARVAQIRRTPGVGTVTPATIRRDAEVREGTRRLSLAAVDPESYARLSHRTGLGAFSAQQLKAPKGDEALPAVVSPSMAALFADGRLGLWMNGEDVTLRVAAVRETTPALSDDFLIVDRAALSRVTGAPNRPTTLLLTATRTRTYAGIDAAALRAAAAPDRLSVTLRATERARYIDSPLQTGATGIYVAAVAAGAGFAALALLLALARAAPERLALLARLRTMGLTRRQARRLLVLEALPQALLAAAGGALTGWAAIRLLSPGLDLTSLALAQTTGAAANHLSTDPLSLFLPAVTVVLLTVGVASAQAWWAGRAGSVRELRAGEGA
ncbi:FtsX-like permease family protein [Streptomyces sp. NPDC016845]|uniref:FtsX-like permease family protein n=1 Tax=Streptomyces sp. NPDC016845 TaxID=3364972 RepID=UPI0037AFB3CB